ncbi:hypothetical protein JCM3775_001731 [Rhodotorula graminis]
MATARPSGKTDLVWALHTFEAENDDELAFSAGERIIVLERDDQYGDGWFQGRNERGEVGLFPQSYTSSRPPSFFPSDGSEHPDSPLAMSTVSPPTPTAAQDEIVALAPDADPAAVQHETLSPTLGSLRRDSVSDASVHSQVDDDELDAAVEGAGGARSSDGAAHRAALAARAMQNAETDAQQERERAERRRRDDEQMYERRKSGYVEGLQLSDESDDEGEIEDEAAPPAPVEAVSSVLPPAADDVEVLQDPDPSRTSVGEPGPFLVRPRADTQVSTYAESVYSNTSVSHVPSLPVPDADLVPPPVALASSSSEPLSPPTAPAPDAAAIALPSSPALPAPEQTADTLESSTGAHTLGDETPHSPIEPAAEPGSTLTDTLKSATESTAVALSAGAAGLVAAVGAAAVATGVALQGDGKAHVDEPVAAPVATQPREEPLAAPVEARAALDPHASAAAAAPPPPEETAVPVEVPARAAAPVQSTAADVLVESSSPVDKPTTTSTFAPGAAASTASAPVPPALVDSARAVTPPPPAQAVSAPAAASPSSPTQSRSSTPATSAVPLSSSVLTTATTAPPSASEQGDAKELPADPMTWGVEDVVVWAKQKGFDALTVSKFEEHEISGDVLLEMDVAMLKEIDLVAFGRRVHIFNAIKELRMRVQPARPASALNASQSTSGGSFLGPALGGGYEPDSPTHYGTSSPLAAYQPPVSPSRWDQHPQQQPLQQDRPGGFGYEDSSAPASLRSPSSLGQQSTSNLRSPRSVTSSADGAGLAAPTHTRSTTADSAAPAAVVVAESIVTKPIPEEPTAETSAPTEGEPSRTLKSPPSTASSLRPRASRRATDKSVGEGSTASTPSSPALGASQERKSSKGEKGSFFGTALPLPGRSRKPPPRVPSALLIDSDGAVARPRPRSSYQDRAKRSTRLFSSFGPGSSSDKASPTSLSSPRSRPSNSTLGGGRDAPTTMTVKSVDPATREMLREKAELVTSGNLMDKIGRPDHSGWMRKRGEKYNTWKMRFFVLKGTYLYYLKSEAEQKAKGVIDLTGYRVIADPSIHPGEYGFKIVHDGARTHFFAAAEQITVRTWMKEIMKATILRDYSAPVVSSCDVEVLPLETAKTMVPYPRPPSPSRRAEIQKERYGGANPNTLSSKDAAILMDMSPGSPLMNGEALFSSISSQKRPSIGANGAQARNESTDTVKLAKSDRSTNLASAASPLAPPVPAEPVPVAGAPRPVRAMSETTNAELLAWLNQNLPASCPLAMDLSSSLRSGRLLVRLVENLSGDVSGIKDAQFDQFHEDESGPFDTAYLDTVFSVFDFLTPRVSTDDVSMEDMISGNASRLSLLVSRARAKYQPEVGSTSA